MARFIKVVRADEEYAHARYLNVEHIESAFVKDEGAPLRVITNTGKIFMAPNAAIDEVREWSSVTVQSSPGLLLIYASTRGSDSEFETSPLIAWSIGDDGVRPVCADNSGNQAIKEGAAYGVIYPDGRVLASNKGPALRDVDAFKGEALRLASAAGQKAE